MPNRSVWWLDSNPGSLTLRAIALIRQLSHAARWLRLCGESQLCHNHYPKISFFNKQCQTRHFAFLFSSFSQWNEKYSTTFVYQCKKRRWCAWNLNLGPLDGIHSAMAVSPKQRDQIVSQNLSKFYHLLIWKFAQLNNNISKVRSKLSPIRSNLKYFCQRM